MEALLLFWTQLYIGPCCHSRMAPTLLAWNAHQQKILKKCPDTHQQAKDWYPYLRVDWLQPESQQLPLCQSFHPRWLPQFSLSLLSHQKDLLPGSSPSPAQMGCFLSNLLKLNFWIFLVRLQTNKHWNNIIYYIIYYVSIGDIWILPYP